MRENPGAVVVVTGCYAQLKSEEIAQIPGVSLVLGSNEKAHLVEYLLQAMQAREADPIAFATSCEGHPAFHHAENTKDIHSFQLSCSRGNRTRYFLKVQDGCNYFCTYCTIPYARGRTTGERFIDLVKALDEIEDIRRYRISSLEPDLCSDELIDYCAHSRAFMPHFHIPLQSGADTVLRLMHRRYDAALFAHKVELIKEKMPHAFIGVDVMVGCRGEPPDCFEECRSFIEGLDVTQLHVFPYSERPGTAALSIPYVVDDKEKKRRVHELLELSDQKTRAFYARHAGTEQEVLLEKSASGKAMHGFTRNYVRVQLPEHLSNPEYDNELLTVRLATSMPTKPP